MKKYIAFLSTVLFLLLMAACDSDTGSLGTSTTPRNDSISIHQATYYATSRSIRVDSILGKSSAVYLGRYTDPESNTTFESNFITQFNCAEGGSVFPPADSIKGDSATRFEIRMFYTTYHGDSLNAMQLEVYDLEKTLQEGQAYYTNLNTDDYVLPGAKPIATKSWSVMDRALDMNELEDDQHYHNVCIPLPTSMGTEIIRSYRAHPEYFANATNFIENVCKGFLIKCSQGDGTVICVEQVNLNVCFRMASNDSIYTTQFTGSQEVLQVNSFDTKGLEPLVDDNTCTWIKSPAGIFTEVTLPVDEITENEQDTINSAQILFTKYNPTLKDKYTLYPPSRLLMIRKSSMYEIFENNQVPNNVTAFVNTLKDSNNANYLAKYNQYAFTNIARLIVVCRNERDRWLADWLGSHPGSSQAEARAAFDAACPDWNKVVLIPVKVSTDSQSAVVAMHHDLSLTSVRLKGGIDPIEIKIITSAFK